MKNESEASTTNGNSDEKNIDPKLSKDSKKKDIPDIKDPYNPDELDGFKIEDISSPKYRDTIAFGLLDYIDEIDNDLIKANVENAIEVITMLAEWEVENGSNPFDGENDIKHLTDIWLMDSNINKDGDYVISYKGDMMLRIDSKISDSFCSEIARIIGGNKSPSIKDRDAPSEVEPGLPTKEEISSMTDKTRDFVGEFEQEEREQRNRDYRNVHSQDDTACEQCGESLAERDIVGKSDYSDGIFCSASCIEVFENLERNRCASVPKELINGDMKDSSSGGKNPYYNVFDGCSDLDSLVLKFPGMSPFMFNAMKAMIGILQEDHGKGSRHNGTNIIRDLNKIEHYIGKEKERRSNP
ncbi:hypothetical protein JHD46_05470 [Sulfurimonas sp. SAG-AH-194-C20]|nr:hypothetical protein [Sulfurimonas sp. SAG-AH-194-C20]MDF1879089.1 hypothetical protein [Sulfurimonas sp. SAG-AH-194-C20]